MSQCLEFYTENKEPKVTSTSILQIIVLGWVRKEHRRVILRR